jgi:hypothetical protein
MFINLTPHSITLVNNEGNIVMEIPSSGIARCESSRTKVFEIHGIGVNKTSFGEISGLPDPVDGTMYIVSRIVAEASKRLDLLVPDETVRDAEGRIIGCKSLAII